MNAQQATDVTCRTSKFSMDSKVCFQNLKHVNVSTPCKNTEFIS